MTEPVTGRSRPVTAPDPVPGSPIAEPEAALGTPVADPAPAGNRSLLAGGTALGVAMLIANAGNYALNLLLGRWLTPAEFSDANLMVALMLTLTSIALCLQLVAARFVGTYDAEGSPERSERLAKTLRQGAAIAGLIAGIVLAAPAPLWSRVFQTESAWPFVILGLGMPFYLVQSVGRGVMQGRMAFRPLALTFIIEMVVRLGTAVLLVAVGLGVNGATIGLSASFVATWLSVHLLSGAHRPTVGPRPELAAVRAYAGSVSILLVGQIITNNADVLVAKANLSPTTAGIYSAVALIGRAVFFLSWSVATVVFPAVAAKKASGGDTSGLLKGGIAAVAGIGTVCILAAWLVGGPVLGIVLGPAYDALSGPLAAYAGMTTLFAIANLIASHQLSEGNFRPSWLVLYGSVLHVTVLLIWHDSIAQLIGAQLGSMVVLLTVITIDQLRRTPHPVGTPTLTAGTDLAGGKQPTR